MIPKNKCEEEKLDNILKIGMHNKPNFPTSNDDGKYSDNDLYNFKDNNEGL